MIKKSKKIKKYKKEKQQSESEGGVSDFDSDEQVNKKNINLESQQHQQEQIINEQDIKKFCQYTSNYDFDELAIRYDELDQYVFINGRGISTIDWKNPKALLTLNQAILKIHYKIDFWDINIQHLCPTIPSRQKYIDWIQYLIQKTLNQEKQQNQNQNNPIKGIDIGTGSSLIYPLLGYKSYGYTFVATDIDQESIENCQLIIEKNNLKEFIQVRTQDDKNKIFEGVIKKEEKFTFSMCNPPFYDEGEHVNQLNWRQTNMTSNQFKTEGGELQFINNMLSESMNFKNNVKIFSTLVGKKCNFEDKDLIKKFDQLMEDNILQAYYKESFHQGQNSRWAIAWIFKYEQVQTQFQNQ